MVRADDRLEPPGRLVVDVAAGRRLAADEPRVDAGRGGIAQIGEAAVPVAVVEQDGASGLEVERR